MAKTNAVAAGLLLLAACGVPAEREAAESDGISSTGAAPADATADPDTPVSSDDPPVPAPPSGPTPECPVVTSGGWSAVVLGKPPSMPDRLRVSGTVTLSDGGVTPRLEQGPVLEIHPPIQRLELVFEQSGGEPRDGPREVAVRGEFAALAEYGAIDIRCGARSLATITDVAWTE